MAKKQHFRRRRYLVEGFQLRYAGLIILLMLLVAAVGSYTAYFTSISLLGEKLSNVYPQGRLVTILKQVNNILLFRWLLIMPLVVAVSIWFSHKIAGPIYRIKQHLRQMASGDYTAKLSLRKNDELVDLSDIINNLQACLNDVTTQNIQAVEKIKADITALQHALDAKEINKAKAHIKELQAHVESVDASLMKCRLNVE